MCEWTNDAKLCELANDVMRAPKDFFFLGLSVGMFVQFSISMILLFFLSGCSLSPGFWAHEAEKVVEDVVEAEEDHHDV